MFEKIFSTGLIVNIVLHVTILYTILANFFMYFIADISSNAINNELKHAIKSGFEPLFENKEKITEKLNELNAQYVELLKQLEQNQSSIILDKINDVKTEIEKLTSITLPDNINDFYKNLSFDYYLKLFNADNSVRKRVNNQLFSQIKIVNILLVLFLFVLVGSLYYSKSITGTELWHILIENIVTFIFVGIVEVAFFLNIALKFVPAPPSLIFKSLLSSLKIHV